MGIRVHRLADGALTVGAVLGVLTLLGALLGVALGVRPLFFRSGSMAPTIATGSLALAREVPAADLAVGDVVSVETGSGSRVTHRVVATEETSGQVRLTLRGDANSVADPEPYVVGSAYRVFWHVPWAGYVIGWLLSPVGLLGIALATAVLVLVSVRGDRGRPSRSGPSPDGGRHRENQTGGRAGRRGLITLMGISMVLLGPGRAPAAWSAPWTDPVPVSGAGYAADTVPASANFACGGLGVLSVTFAWTAVSGATSYTVHYGSGGGQTVTTTSTSLTIVSVISGGTAWVVANHDFGAVTWSSPASNTRSYTVALVSLCS